MEGSYKVVATQKFTLFFMFGQNPEKKHGSYDQMFPYLSEHITKPLKQSTKKWAFDVIPSAVPANTLRNGLKYTFSANGWM